MILIKSFVLLVVAVASHAQAQNAGPGGSGMGMRMHKRNDPSMKKRIADAVALLERRALEPPLNISFLSQDSNTTPSGGESSTSESSSTSSTRSTTQPPPSSTSSTTSRNDPPTTTLTTSTSTSTPTSTSTSSSTSTTRTSTSNAVVMTAISRTSQDTYAGISFASTGSVPLRASQTTSDDAATDTSTDSGGSFSQNKVAIAATATVAALVALGALIFLGFWWKKKSDRGKMAEDMWDEASMKEFPHGPGATIVAPPPAARHLDLEDELGGSASGHSHGGMSAAGAGGLGRSNTKVLPSQSAYAGAAGMALSRSRSQHTTEYEDEPDGMLAMPPVAHYDRPRDSAYDIVPAAPPTSAYATAGGAQGYASAGYGYSNGAAGGSGGGGGGYGTSGGLAPPHRRGDHTSFGSGLGNDPFAGSGLVDSDRESTYGPGQAGRGAGGAGAASGGAGVQGAGNQWPPGYNPYTGYSQGSQAPYGHAGYGYAS